MKQTLSLSLCALTLALCIAAHGPAPVIVSFSNSGVLVCSNLVPGTVATLEWAPSTTGSWTNNWAGLEAVTADSNGMIQVSVPTFYRVRGTGTPAGMVRIPAGSLAIGNASLALSAVSAQGQLPVINSFIENGVLVCSNLVPCSEATVEWAPTPAGPWASNWAGLEAVTVDSNGMIQVIVPMVQRVRGIEIPPPPVVADFSGIPASGLAPLPVLFTNLSSGATNYFWDFGDGNSSAEQHPSNTYHNAGAYTVTLTAVGPGGTNTLMRTNHIMATNLPPAVAGFTGSPTIGLAPLTVFFTNLSSEATNYSWDFGDGNTSAEVNRTNTYVNAGNYTVMLTAIGPGGANTLTRSNYVIVTNVPPVVVGFDAVPTNGLAPLVVDFNNLSSGATNYAWDFGDGNSSGMQHPSNTYSNAGSYTVSLTAIGPGGTNTLTNTNYIVATNPPPPVAAFTGSPTIGLAPLTVYFTNLSIEATNYSWDFGDGKTSSALNPTNIFTNAGIYDVSLAVIGPGGTNTLTRSNYVIVTNLPPVVAGFDAVPTNGLAPLAVAFTNLSSGATNYVWDFGDGNSSATQHPSNTYSNAGIYTVSLIAVGAAGTNTLRRTNYIVATNPPPPVAGFTASPTNGPTWLAVSFSNLSSRATNYCWDFGDGNTSAAINPTNIYRNAGTYNVSLTAVGPGGTSTVTRTNYIMATNPPPVLTGFSGSPTNGLAPLTVYFTNLSSGATNYIWDFGNGRVSTNVNPANVFFRAGSYTVTLTAVGLGGTNTLALTNYVVVGETASAPAGMVLIPAGSFVMGNCMNPNEGYSDELPLHTLNLSAFYMDQYEVTKELWDEVANWAVTNGYNFDYAGSGKASNHPVQTISYYDAVKWCNARSEMEGRTPAYYLEAAQTNVYRSGQINLENDWVNWTAGFRLPTEAEWEEAARGGASGHRFPWSDVETISHSQANYYSFEGYFFDTSPTRGFPPAYSTGGYPYTSPVGSFAANGYGLYDMAGNVWEWCWDRYSDTYYSSSPNADPRGPAFSPGGYRVIRGGTWYGEAYDTRCAKRVGNNPANAYFSLGLRCLWGFSMTNPPPVVAGFVGGPINGLTPLLVLFTNLSSGASSYSWDFGDGNLSASANPTHIYTNAGSFTVCLTAMGPGGTNSLARTNYIVGTEPAPVVADFTGSPTSGLAPLTVFFTNLSSGATNYTWDFGNGGVSADVNPATLFLRSGTYAVRLTAVGPGVTNALTRTNYIVVEENTSVPSGMVLIPAGSFIMGNCMDPSEGYSDELPLHTVNVSACYMDQYEVTKALWDEVTTWAVTNGYTFNSTGSGAANHPVLEIEWYDMVKWCNARSERDGRTPAYYTSAAQTTVYRSGSLDVNNNCVNWTSGYRLPTEAEWEKAARGGASGHRFPWTDVDTITHSQANYCVYTEHGTNYYTYDISPTPGPHPTYAPGTSPVGSFAANGYGLYDMAGNAWEWCWDWYDDAYYSSSPTTDPRGPVSSPDGARVLRGGWWLPDANKARCADRNGFNTVYSGPLFGFRCVNGLFAANQPPAVAGFTACPTNGQTPLTVVFTNLSSGATNYTWDFGDGNFSAAVNPTNIFANAGSYTVSLTAIGPGGTSTFSRIHYIVATNPPPVVADFRGNPTNGPTWLAVSFINLSSGASRYNWDFGDGHTSTAANPANIYSNAGSFTVSLTAIGPGGTNTLMRTNYIAVAEPPPVVADFTAGPTNGCVWLSVRFTNLSSGASYYRWDFGDGNTSTNVNPSMTYANAGNYSVSLTAVGPGGTNILTRTNYIVTTNLPLPLLTSAIAAAQEIDLRSNLCPASIDSFDSADPNYSDKGLYPEGQLERTKATGDVCTRGAVENTLWIGSADIKGKVKTGPGGTITISPMGSVGDRAWVEGGNKGIKPGWSANDYNVVYSDVTLPTVMWYTPPAGGIVNGTNYEHLFMHSGNFKVLDIRNKIYIGTNANVRIWLYDDTFQMIGNDAVIRIAPVGASLKIYMTGASCSMAGLGVVNESGNAKNFYYFGLPSNTSLNFSGNAPFTGVIYAPQADFSLGSGGGSTNKFIGASVTKSFRLNSRLAFHYDENLARVSSPP